MITLTDAVKAWLVAANPGLVRREDLTRLEEQLDELLALVDAIEAKLATRPPPVPPVDAKS